MQALLRSGTWQTSYWRWGLTHWQKIRRLQLKAWWKGRCRWSWHWSSPQALLKCHETSEDDNSQGGWWTCFPDRSADSVSQKRWDLNDPFGVIDSTQQQRKQRVRIRQMVSTEDDTNCSVKITKYQTKHVATCSLISDNTIKIFKHIVICRALKTLHHRLRWETVSFSYICNRRILFEKLSLTGEISGGFVTPTWRNSKWKWHPTALNPQWEQGKPPTKALLRREEETLRQDFTV